MRTEINKSNLRRTGKGFICITVDGLAGRRLTPTFMDQRKNTYVEVNGELTLLRDEHSFLSVD